KYEGPRPAQPGVQRLFVSLHGGGVLRHEGDGLWSFIGQGALQRLRFHIDASAEMGNRRDTNRKSEENRNVTRVVGSAPFIANYEHGSIELFALAPHPSTNAQAWLPNGVPSNQPFPSDHGNSWA